MSQSQSLGDTPLKATGAFINGTHQEQIAAVMNDFGNIPEVTVDFMLDHIVPNSGTNVRRTTQDLRRKGILLDDGWDVFIDALPKDSADNKQKVFLKMGTIYQQIIASTKFDMGHPPSPILAMGTCSDIAPISKTNIRSRPDGCGQLMDGHSFHTSQCGYPSQVEGKYHWFNIAYVAEYMMNNTMSDLNHNILKILWSLHHMMNIDHRRRFAFGITIENTDTRIWFCCRETVLVTQPFDFMKEPAKLIQLISSLAYADVVKLGYDPTMELFWNGRWNYRITIEGKDNHRNIITRVYETTNIIADSSYNLRGRATRIYEACNIDNPGTKVVIKDSWVAANDPKEGDTLSEILEGASEDEKAMFLTVLLHGVVMVHGRQDLTQDLLMNGYLITTNDPIIRSSQSHNIHPCLMEMMAKLGNADHDIDVMQSNHVYKASIFQILKTPKLDSDSTNFITSNSFPIPQIIHPPHVYGPKAHYRIVFKERGESLYSSSRLCQIKLPLVVQAMNDVLKALAFLTKKGYVHRDISPGNIIIYEGHAKLNDLEFSKKYETGTSNYVRTGTCKFMAVEVEHSGYLYTNSDADFSHNPLHDLESLWWVGVWFLLCHYNPCNLLDNTIQRHMKLIRMAAEKLFNNGIDSPSRYPALPTPYILTASNPANFSQPIQHFVILIDMFRTQLMEYYKNYKPHDQAFFTPDIYHKFGDLFVNPIEALWNDSTELWPSDHIAQHLTYLQNRSGGMAVSK